MYVVEVVKHARKISPREGALLGVKLLSGGILVGQMVRRTYQNGIGHVVRLFDVIIDEAADVQDLHEDVFSDDNVLIPPVRVMPHCFGQRGTGRAIFSSLNKNIGTPELGETNKLVGVLCMIQHHGRLCHNLNLEWNLAGIWIAPPGRS